MHNGLWTRLKYLQMLSHSPLIGKSKGKNLQRINFRFIKLAGVAVQDEHITCWRPVATVSNFQTWKRKETAAVLSDFAELCDVLIPPSLHLTSPRSKTPGWSKGFWVFQETLSHVLVLTAPPEFAECSGGFVSRCFTRLSVSSEMILSQLELTLRCLTCQNTSQRGDKADYSHLPLTSGRTSPGRRHRTGPSPRRSSSSCVFSRLWQKVKHIFKWILS